MATKKTYTNFTEGTYTFRFLPKNKKGQVGDWSAFFTFTVNGDSTPPPVPSAPQVEAVIGGVYVKWVDAGYTTPVDFNRVDVYVSNGGPYTKFGSIATINGGITYSAPDGVTGPFTFKFIGVDRSGNASEFSQASSSVSALTLDIDTTPPDVPSGLSVVAYSDPSDSSGGTGYVNVTWNPSSSTDLLGHYIRYGRSATVWDSYEFMEKGQNSKRISNLRAGTTYYFQINATDGSNPSSYVPSTPVSATIPGDTTAPAAPSGLVAVAGFNNIVAYWNRNTENDVDLGRGTYQFQLSTSSAFLSVDSNSVVTGTVASFTGLSTGTTYYVRVRAIDSSGNIGSWSTPVSATPGKVNAELSLSAGTIVGNLVAANTIVGDKLVANTIDADRLKTNTGIVGKLYVGDDAGTNKITLDGTATLPAVYYGSGNYGSSDTPFYFDALGKFSLKDQLTWNGSALTVKGSLNVTQASSFTGNVTLNSGGDMILNGGAIRATGTTGRVEIGSAGIFGYNATSGGTALFSLFANTGQIKVDGGTIGGWTINTNSITTTNSSSQVVGLYSNGQLYMGPNFSVGSDGSVTVKGVITVLGSGSNVATTTQLDAVNTTATNAQSTANSASSTATTANTNATNALNTANAALPATSFNKSEVIKKINNTTNGTTIDGGVLTTGTVIADNVVSTYVYAGYIESSQIKAGSINVTLGIGSSGAIYSGKTYYASPSSGYYIGYNGTTPAFDIGSSSEYVRWNGTRIFVQGDLAAGGSGQTDYMKTGYNRTTPDGLYTITSFGINAISMVSTTTAGVVSHWYPYLEAGNNLGIAAFRWNRVYAINTTISSSDERTKFDIDDTDLGLDFIRDLRPVKYKRVYEYDKPVIDENGQPIIENGKRVTDGKNTTYGERHHYGLIAQEVKQSLDSFGIADDFAGWTLDDTSDPLSRQGLSYEQFIAPTIKAVQELADMVDLLKQEIIEIKGLING